jgi:hypothetical protein
LAGGKSLKVCNEQEEMDGRALSHPSLRRH